MLLWRIKTAFSELLVVPYLYHINKFRFDEQWLNINVNRCIYYTSHYYSLHPLPRLSHSNVIQTRCTQCILVGRWEWSGTVTDIVPISFRSYWHDFLFIHSNVCVVSGLVSIDNKSAVANIDWSNMQFQIRTVVISQKQHRVSSST